MNLPVLVTASCSHTGEQKEAEIVLEMIGQNLTWRHWQIASRTWGGSLVDSRCD
jgi:hypothetical protein